MVGGVFIGEGLALMGTGVGLMATRSGGACTTWVGDACTARDELQVGPQVLIFSGMAGAGLIHVIAGISAFGLGEHDARGKAMLLAALELSVATMGATTLAGSAWALSTEPADGACNSTQDGTCTSTYNRGVSGYWLTLGLGGAFMLAGTIVGLWTALSAPDALPSERVMVLPHADPTGFGLDVSGRF